MKETLDNHIGICQKIEILAKLSKKLMHFIANTLCFLQVHKDVKDFSQESETTWSIYGFLVEDQLKKLLDKPVEEERVEVNKDKPKEKKNEELEKNEGT